MEERADEPSEWGHREMDGQAREGNGRAERERTSQYAATYRSTYTTAAFNFYEYRARAYNAKLGRFMSEDPKLFDAGDYNLFRYCHNDPIDNVDPMGLESPAWAEAIIPGQVESDNAVANWQAGNYGTAAGWAATMVAQQFLAVGTLGASMRAQQPSKQRVSRWPSGRLRRAPLHAHSILWARSNTLWARRAKASSGTISSNKPQGMWNGSAVKLSTIPTILSACRQRYASKSALIILRNRRSLAGKLCEHG